MANKDYQIFHLATDNRLSGCERALRWDCDHSIYYSVFGYMLSTEHWKSHIHVEFVHFSSPPFITVINIMRVSALTVAYVNSSENIAGFRRFGRQQHLNEWR